MSDFLFCPVLRRNPKIGAIRFVSVSVWCFYSNKSKTAGSWRHLQLDPNLLRCSYCILSDCSMCVTCVPPVCYTCVQLSSSEPRSRSVNSTLSRSCQRLKHVVLERSSLQQHIQAFCVAPQLLMTKEQIFEGNVCFWGIIWPMKTAAATVG